MRSGFEGAGEEEADEEEAIVNDFGNARAVEANWRSMRFVVEEDGRRKRKGWRGMGLVVLLASATSSAPEGGVGGPSWEGQETNSACLNARERDSNSIGFTASKCTLT